ncbi:hypothetical protein [Lentibacillus cibarius]|uniref:Uncharacterized protein n=1 Tax=Lentibacillus cibarius TaxID=2583219 RepID=A0A5S3QFZ9_9BACI|nr:hypothetical protein [Lentibacillus cibarius]TMN20810.1 hypothetical protein FFL34_00800 [Lentibacillus cibarius]
MNQQKRNKLFGNYIYVDCNKWIYHKNELFWHLISLHENEKFNILPCNNCSSGTFCPAVNCLNSNESVELTNGQKRNICLYRGVRLPWVNEILNLANKDDENIMLWKEDIEGKRLNKKIYIRFKHQGADYTLVLEERYRKGVLRDYYLITAFPTFYVNKKYTFDKKYQEYIATLELTKK